eukprot:jgi/Botrbrau1/14187/Bobra.182_3s0120.1
MPAKAKRASERLTAEMKFDFKEWVSKELNDPARLAANLQLLRALSLFFGSVFVMKNFGEIFAI